MTHARVRATAPINTKAIKRPLGKRAVKVSQPKAPMKKIKTTPAPKHSFESLHIKSLNVTVFDETVRGNLQKFGALLPADRAAARGYELIKRAYKAALSSQERNPKLPDARFDEQKSTVHSILVPLAGVAPINDSVLE